MALHMRIFKDLTMRQYPFYIGIILENTVSGLKDIYIKNLSIYTFKQMIHYLSVVIKQVKKGGREGEKEGGRKGEGGKEGRTEEKRKEGRWIEIFLQIALISVIG